MAVTSFLDAVPSVPIATPGNKAGMPQAATTPQSKQQSSSATATASGGSARGGPQFTSTKGGVVNINSGMGPGLILIVLVIAALFIVFLVVA